MKSKKIIFVLLSLLLIIIAVKSVSLHNKPNMFHYQTAVTKIEHTLTESWKQSKVPSMVLVLEDGKTVYEKSFGYIDRNSKKQWSKEHITNIGSVSKLFVTASILKLNEQGKLSMDDPVIKYIPELEMADERYRDITVKMLLNHTSGLPGTNYDQAMLLEEDNNKDYFKTLLIDLKDESLKSKPGEYSVYCNEGFILAQKIVENVSKQRYIDFLNDEILNPMGISNVFHSSDPDMLNKKFVPYYDASGNLSPREVVIESFDGTGGLSTDIQSLAVFGERILSPKYSVLNKNSIQLFTEEQGLNSKLANLTPFNGLGFDYVKYPYGDLPVYSKSGGTVQYLTQLVIAPEQKITVVGVSTNPSYIGKATEELMLEILKEKKVLTANNSAFQEKKEFITPPNSTKDKLGKYSFIGGALTIDVKIDGNELSLSMVPLSQIGNEFGEKKYYYHSDGAFWSEEEGGKIEKFSFLEIDRKIFLIRHLRSAEVEYAVAYAQKLTEGIENYTWSQKSGSIWLKENIKFNALLGIQDYFAQLSLISGIHGYVSFVRQTPFKIIDDQNAITVNETARDAGNLVMKDHKITFRGSIYVAAENIKEFDKDNAKNIIIKDDAIALWYKVSKPIKLIIHSVQKEEVRVVVINQNGEVTYDSVNCNDVARIEENSYLMICGKQFAKLSIESIEEKES